MSQSDFTAKEPLKTLNRLRTGKYRHKTCLSHRAAAKEPAKNDTQLYQSFAGSYAAPKQNLLVTTKALPQIISKQSPKNKFAHKNFF